MHRMMRKTIGKQTVIMQCSNDKRFYCSVNNRFRETLQVRSRAVTWRCFVMMTFRAQLGCVSTCACCLDCVLQFTSKRTCNT